MDISVKDFFLKRNNSFCLLSSVAISGGGVLLSSTQRDDTDKKVEYTSIETLPILPAGIAKLIRPTGILTLE